MSIVVHGAGLDADGTDLPSGEELADVLERVHEEVQTARLLVRQIDLKEALAAHVVTALRESLLVRILRLRQFFYGRSEEDWELVAADYFPRVEDWISVRPLAGPHITRWVDDLRVRVVDHVYVDRGSRVPEEAWPLASVVEALVAAHEIFCDGVVEHHEKTLGIRPWPQPLDEDMVSGSSGTGSSDVPD